MKFKFLLFFFGIVCSTVAFAQDDVNQNDANGARHGVWKKFYPGTNQLRYEGNFEHGKEVGTFKFYCEKCGEQPSVVKKFKSNSNVSEVSYFTVEGSLVSSGLMDKKDRTGEWLYYHKNSKNIMTREFYTDGLLDGKKTVYYPNGNIAEELIFEKGFKVGRNVYYSENGVLLKDLLYVNDKLHGPAKYFDANGNKTIEGQYKQGKKDGLWKYYKFGEIVLEETYPKPLNKIED